MVVENFVLGCFSAAHSILMFLRPVLAVFIGLSSIVLCILFYFQYKYNIFPKEVVKEIEEYDVMNFKGLGKLILDLFKWLGAGAMLIFFMYEDFPRRLDLLGIILGIAFCAYAARVAYKVYQLYYSQNKT